MKRYIKCSKAIDRLSNYIQDLQTYVRDVYSGAGCSLENKSTVLIRYNGMVYSYPISSLSYNFDEDYSEFINIVDQMKP